MKLATKSLVPTAASADSLMEEGLMSVAEVGEFLSLSRSAVWKLMANGELPWTHLGGARRIPRVSVKRLAVKRFKL